MKKTLKFRCLPYSLTPRKVKLGFLPIFKLHLLDPHSCVSFCVIRWCFVSSQTITHECHITMEAKHPSKYFVIEYTFINRPLTVSQMMCIFFKHVIECTEYGNVFTHKQAVISSLSTALLSCHTLDVEGQLFEGCFKNLLISLTLILAIDKWQKRTELLLSSLVAKILSNRFLYCRCTRWRTQKNTKIAGDPLGVANTLQN